MSSEIVLPNLTSWTESRLRAMYEAKSSQALDSAVDAFLTKDANITVNGVHLSREAFKKELSGQEFLESSASVNFNNAVEVEKDPAKTGSLSGSVGVFYEATISRRIVIHDAPLQSIITSSLNVVIIQDESIPVPHLPHGVHGFSDRRRVSQLNQVFVSKSDNIIHPLGSN